MLETSKRPKIVIVGAGFGGLSATRELADSPVDVTLLDRQNYHLFQPLLYQVATAALTPAEIAAPIRGILRRQRNATVFMDEVCGVDTGAKEVATTSGRRIPYDALVLATGARHSYFGQDGWAAFAPGLKSIDDAFALRKKILLAFEQAEMSASEDDAYREAQQTFVVIGGGPTGVELAGAIAELAHSMARDFRRIEAEGTRILLVEGGDRLVPSFDPALSDRVMKDLASLGVDVRLNTMVSEIGDGFIEAGDERIRAGTVLWAAGVQASPAANWLGVETGRSGHVPVTDTLTIHGHPEIYAIGDTAAHVPKGAERPLPGVAPVAKQMGIYVGRRLARLARGKAPGGAFRYLDYGSMATIGRNRAIAEIGGLHISGFVGWLLWGLAHVYFLIGYRNRLFVMLTWLWSYVTWQRGVRLITGRE
ncbi:MAG: NAD(P)/FAD-dependent oxidoreductase [Pseudomonadota bacterium]